MNVIEKAIEDFFVYRKFGIFVHWGLYSLLGGVWKGRSTPYIGEWIMRRCRIPVAEYQTLAAQFNPARFDADRWIEAVERAGAKYFVFTAKHHDGFAMYHSKADKYNIIDASKYPTDPVAALAKACEKRGIKFCLYYSQDQDWHHPHGSGNDWDFDESKKDFSIFFNEKVKPQVTELLTQYGPIGLIWFDTPATITKPHSQELFDLVHRLQPACLVNGRLGHGMGDYAQTEDNDMPAGATENAWEIPATMNDTWGYKRFDTNWKSAQVLIRQLIEAVSKGGNYLLNIGPDADGAIPAASIERLEAIGRWLKTHQKAIYGVKPSPFPMEFPWGCVTSNCNRLFLNVLHPNKDKIELMSLKNKVVGAALLGNHHRPVFYEQSDANFDGCYKLSLHCPGLSQNTEPCVIAVEVDGAIQVDKTIVQQPDGKIVLEAHRGLLHAAGGQKLGSHSSIHGWTTAEGSMEWVFKVHTPGCYEIAILTAALREDGDPATPIEWEGGHQICVTVAGRRIQGCISETFEVAPEGSYARFIGSSIGQIQLPAAGQYTLVLTADKVFSNKGLGFTLRSVCLNAVKSSPHTIAAYKRSETAQTRAPEVAV